MRKLKNTQLTFLFLLLALVFSTHVLWALEKDTHDFLNKKIARNYSILNSYLKDNLGFSKGIDEIALGKTVEEWLGIGGKTEDEPIYTRSLNHFHDPLKPWSSAGFKGTFKSSVIWAQDQGWISSQFGGDWSWKKARESFYKGLTSAAKFDREINLAFTFQALGQIMHLVEDASVPAHVRNDAHIIGFHYEKWVEKNLKTISLAPKAVDKSIFSQAVSNSSTPVPISALWDIDKYTGSNLNVTFGTTIGIAEYTNANFFSEDTIFKNYPHPTYDDTNYHIAFKYPEKVDAEDGKFDNRVYIKKTIGDVDTRLASFGYISYDVIKKGYYQFSPFVLDDKVYKDYASLLIPRAVGYSAGLLNYFFRGEIDLIPDDARGSGYVIENKTDEDMSGTFELWYDNKSDERVKLKSWSLSIGKKSSGNNKSSNIYFTLPLDAKKFCKYILVFKGQMGQEQDAVVGKIVNPEGCYLWAVLSINEWRSIYEHVWPPIVSIAFKGGKKISKQLPIYNAIKYKFAEGNPFIFGILSVEYKYIENYGSVPAVYKVDLFEINKDTSDINHLGEVLRIDNPYGYASGDFGLVWCDNLSRGLYSELSAQDLFISNDGKTVNVIGSYKKFIGWKEIWRKETPYGMGCVGYGEFESGYFINNNRYPLGISPSWANVNVNPLNPNELFLSYNHAVYTNTDVKLDYTCYSWGWGGGSTCSWNGQIVWTVNHNKETKIGSTIIFSNKKTVKYTDSYPNRYRSSEVLEDITTGQPYTLNSVLERDKGISVSLKSAIDPQDTVSYSSEKGFFCPNRENKPALVNSYGERYFKYITCYRYIGCLDNVAFSLRFNECFSGATDGYLAPWGEQVQDVTFWRNWREE
ncbi:MAG: hypothetical protein HY755_12260 [Nitrospirae bacterium]|nr:hypothetical protein [Nitrospirota bacterium]